MYKAITLLVLSQFVFYVLIYVFLRMSWPLWKYMLIVSPLFIFTVGAPLWAMRATQQHHWPLLPIQLVMFAAAVAASLFGIMVLARQSPTTYGWVGLALVIAGVVVSSIKV